MASMVESTTMSIYGKIQKPILALSPMEDVTDSVFRQIVASIQRPDIFYTEFVNVEGLNSKGKEKVIHRLKYDVSERPIVAQLWGIEPNNFYKSSKLVKDLGFDGVDINMGCSVKKVVQRNAGSGLIREERELVRDIIQSVKDGANGIPVSVKTRLGWEEYDSDWIEFLLKQNLDVLTIHGRTARGKNCIKANWDDISKCVKLRDIINTNTLIFGNGDITSHKQAKEYAKKYKVDGVMIGRAAISNPWIFSGKEDITQKERYMLMKKHVKLFENTWGNTKDFNQIKKFFKGYISGFDGASSIRQKLMEVNSAKQALILIEDLL